MPVRETALQRPDQDGIASVNSYLRQRIQIPHYFHSVSSAYCLPACSRFP